MGKVFLVILSDHAIANLTYTVFDHKQQVYKFLISQITGA